MKLVDKLKGSQDADALNLGNGKGLCNVEI